MLTERQKYLRLLSMVIEVLPTSAISEAVRDGYQAPHSLLNNVRIGRVQNLGHLIALIGYGLPAFEIPAELRPAPTPAPLLA